MLVAVEGPAKRGDVVDSPGHWSGSAPVEYFVVAAYEPSKAERRSVQFVRSVPTPGSTRSCQRCFYMPELTQKPVTVLNRTKAGTTAA
jgi:hypothetical protein